MTWVRIDDGFADHPKIISAGPLAALIQVRALCYSARHLTDGFIPDGAVAGFVAGMEHISIASGGVPGLFEVGDEATDLPWPEIMVDANLWEKVAGGYRVHDYLDYNPSKSDVMQLRRKKAKAGRAGGQAFARARALARDEHAVTEEEGPRTRTRTPTPTPKKNLKERESGARTRRALPARTNGRIPEWDQIPGSIAEALSRAPRLGADARLQRPAWWQAHYRANPRLHYAAEVLKAEAWLVANPRKAPRGKDLSRFLHNWLERATPPTEV